MIRFACARCGRKIKVEDGFSGRAGACPTCREPLVVPAVGETETVDTSGAAGGPAGDGSAGERLPSLPGDGGRYTLVGEIARGGMGAVVRAVDRDIRREVALKFMLDDRDARLAARFLEEARITGQLEHPNIVPVHELGHDAQKRPYFSMKLVRGRSLAQVLDRLRQEPASAREWSTVRLVNVLVGVCNALAYAHSRGVIHRDLKPANVMVGDFGEVYVMDWGLAKSLKGEDDGDALPSREGGAAGRVVTGRKAPGDQTQDGAVLGTPAYMPPEQAMGRVNDLDERSDVYALGAILYAVLTLRPPVEPDGDYLAVLVRAAQGEVVPPEERTPERAGQIPPELSAVALKALAKEPGDRYPTAEAFRRDLELFLEGRSVSAKADTAWELFRKLVRRNKGTSVATAAALLALAVLAGAASAVNYRARVRAEDNYEAFLREQAEKHARTRKAAPAFVRAARLSANDKQFDDALAQVELALEYDPEQTEAYLLKGQLLIGLERFADAVEPLEEYGRRNPDDEPARRLAGLAGRPEPEKAAYYQQLGRVFEEQKALALVERMTHLAERFLGPGREMLALYQKRLDVAWPGLGKRLTLDKKGEFSLALNYVSLVRDLTPLKGLPLARLDLRNCPIQDLEPLRGMPLVSLDLSGCTRVRDLRPLKGMSLTFLGVMGLNLLTDLEPLRGMPLQRLELRGLGKLVDLAPLENMPLTSLGLLDCWKVEDLTPLRRMQLTSLHLGNCYAVKDLAALRGMPLKMLNMGGLRQVKDFEPLRGLPLARLYVSACPFPDLNWLEGMSLTELELRSCAKVKDLSPLRGMKLTYARLEDLKQVPDFRVLKGMPLTHLDLSHCPHLGDLEFLRGMSLRVLKIVGSRQVRDLSPLEGMELKSVALSPLPIRKGLDVLRGMSSLESVAVDRDRRFEAADFWKLYDEGEFGK